MTEEVLKIENLSKTFKDFHALTDVSIELKKGRIYGLIGKNGAGKTTLMRIIGGLSFPTKGTIELFGKSARKEYESNLKKIGILIEYPSLNRKMTAKENMKLQRIIRGVKKDNDDELLELVGLSGTGKKKVGDFSLGMRQRLGIAAALVVEPKLLILDEPVNGLDPVGVVEIRNLIKKLCEERGITVLISSHNLPELFQTATDYIIIDKGQIKQTLTLDELESKCSHYLHIGCENSEKLEKVIKDTLCTSNYKSRSDGSIELYDYIDNKEKVMNVLTSNNIIPTEFSIEGETLEDYFLSAIGGKKDE